jgi:hypothetical protein
VTSSIHFLGQFDPDDQDPLPEIIQWNPKSSRVPELRAAVAGFEPVDIPAGKRNAKFLKEEALDNHPSTVTHLHLKDGKLEGFFALSSGTAKLIQSDARPPVGQGDRELVLSPRQPVAHIAWIGRSRDSSVKGSELLALAAGIALEVVEAGQGQLALSLDAFDEATADMWVKNFGFNRSLDFDGRIPLWRSLDEIPGEEDDEPRDDDEA